MCCWKCIIGYPHLVASSMERAGSARGSARFLQRHLHLVRALRWVYSRYTAPDPRLEPRKASGVGGRRIRRSYQARRGMWPRMGSAGTGCWGGLRRHGGKSPGFAEGAEKLPPSRGRKPRWVGCQRGPVQSRTRSSLDVTSPHFCI